MSPFSVCRLLFSAIWLRFTLMAYKFQALQYTHYQHVIVKLGVDKWTYEVAVEFKSTGTLCIQTPYKVQRVEKKTDSAL